ncbi:hypothetical protein F5X98DRAFT_357922 [Xylaria grammica]|nr:hypothetical protein F5X98DRAFT_357922 [Xylaria grammica]
MSSPESESEDMAPQGSDEVNMRDAWLAGDPRIRPELYDPSDVERYASQVMRDEMDEEMDLDPVLSSSDADSTHCPSDQPEHYSDSSGEEGPQTSVEVGRGTTRAFHGGFRDCVAVGVGDNESDNESLYEEADFPMDLVASLSEDKDVYMSDDAYTPSSDEYDDSAYSNKEHNGKEHNIQQKQVNDATQPTRKHAGDPVPINKESFAYLQGHSFPANSFKLKQSHDRAKCRVLELEEIKRMVGRELAKAVREEESFGKKLDSKYEGTRRRAERLGISMQLWDEYQAFCESMEPEFGSTKGWSITCDVDHQGSYVKYDPEFTLFKEHCEPPWNQLNFRCEATVTENPAPGFLHQATPKNEVVEFWPVVYPSLDTDYEWTWGDLYPTLYDLANKAAQGGSEAALDMLVALPDRDAPFKKGWLFEYSTADLRSCREPGYSVSGAGFTWEHNPIHSRRWTYRSAHNVAAPEDEATRRTRIQQILTQAGVIDIAQGTRDSEALSEDLSLVPSLRK